MCQQPFQNRLQVFIIAFEDDGKTGGSADHVVEQVDSRKLLPLVGFQLIIIVLGHENAAIP